MTTSTNAYGMGLAGMRAAEARFQARAINIANVNSEDYRPLEPKQTTDENGRPQVAVTRATTDVPFVKVEEDLVDARQAAHAYRASAAVVRTADQMSKTLLDTFA